MLRATPFSQFSIERGVMNHTRDKKLGFIKQLDKNIRHTGVRLHASLGMSAVELVRSGEMRDITLRHGDITFDEVQSVVEEELAWKKVAGLGQRLQLKLGKAKVYTPRHEQEWVGIPVLPNSHGRWLARNRIVIGQVLTAMTGEEIELPPRELFLNIGKIDVYSHTGIDETLAYVDAHAPKNVDVYDVSVREGTLYRPPS